MRKAFAALAASLCLASSALAQVPSSTLPPNTVVGRLGVSAGPSQAIPFNILLNSIGMNGFTGGSQCAINAVLCFQFSSSDFVPFNPAIWNDSFAGFGSNASLPGTTAIGTANQFALTAQVNVPLFTPPTAAAYEKGAFIAQCSSLDATPVVSMEHGCVGADLRGIILAPQTLGEAWGAVTWAEAQGDGFLTSLEADLINTAGSDQPNLNQATTKIGVQSVAAGNINGTAAFLAANGIPKWHKGYAASPSALVPLATDPNASFLELAVPGGTPLFRVKPDGTVAQSTPSTGPLGQFLSTTAGTPAGLVLGVTPTVGAVNDQGFLNFDFATSAGVAYTGGQVAFNQLNASPGAHSTELVISNVAAGGALTNLLFATSGGWFPNTDNAMQSGLTNKRWQSVNAYVVNTKPNTFATLTAATPCNSTNEGSRGSVTDGSTATAGATLAGGGANHVPAYCNGTNWVVF